MSDETEFTLTGETPVVTPPPPPQEKDRSISLFAAIMTSLVVSLMVSGIALTAYHRYLVPPQTKIVAFDYEGYNEELASQLSTGKLKQEDLGPVLARLEEKIKTLPKGTIILREDVVLSEVETLTHE